MKKTIQKVQDYFKGKLMSKDFEIITQDKYNLTIKIDEEYIFVIWIANMFDWPNTVKVNENRYNFMTIPITDKESAKLCELLKDGIKKYRHETLISQKEEELKKLKEGLI